MKTLLTFAAAVAVLTSASAASAHERDPGHWEWQNRPVYGPNKSNLPTRVRVWVKEAPAMANCDCAMMQGAANRQACMEMPGHSKS